MVVIGSIVDGRSVGGYLSASIFSMASPQRILMTPNVPE